MKREFLLAVLLAMSSISVFGRLGETKEQCLQRYGKPKISGTLGNYQYAAYEKSGFVISILFGNDKKAGRVVYAKLNVNHPVYKSELRSRHKKFIDVTRETFGKVQLKPEEIQAFINANGGGNWVWQQTNKKYNEWQILMEKNVDEILWEWRLEGNKTDPNKTAVYHNIFPDNMLIFSDQEFKNFSWEKAKEEARKRVKTKKKKHSLEGF